MNKNLHKMDEIFNAAYKGFSENPSSNVWDKISSGLDKVEASSYKRRLRRWKQVAIFSLLLLAGFVLYETILKNNPIPSNKNESIAIDTNERAETTDQQGRDINRIHSTIDVSITAVTGKPHTNDVLPGHLNEDNIKQYHQQYKETLIFSSAENTRQSLEKEGYPFINNAIGSSPERNNSDKKVFLQTDAQSRYLDIIRELPAKNNSARSNQLLNPRWTLSAYVSSDRPGYRLDKDGPALLKIKEHEDHQPSFSAGILIARHVKNRLALQTGLIYSNTTIVISPEQIYASRDQTGKVLYKYVVSSGYAYVKPSFVSAASPGDSLTAEAGEHVLQCVAVPLMFTYDLIKNNKWIVSPGFGVTGNFLTSAKVETDLEGSSKREHVSIRKLDGIRPFNWSLMGAVTLEYMVTRRMSINVRPFLSYAMSPITSGNDVETFPYNIGIGAGASYRF